MTDDDLVVRAAGVHDADAVALLFDAYRQFYGMAPDVPLARRFIRQRLELGDSLIFVAEDQGGAPIAFVQVYPTLSSIRCEPVWVLNDLFVAERARRSGVAERLMNAVTEAAADSGVSSISLSTAHDNVAAQRLYERLGYVRDEQFRTYSLEV